MATVREGSSADISITLLDGAGVAIPLASLITLTLTLFDLKTNAIINSRNAVNILNANGCTVTDGAASLRLVAADNVIVSTSERFEPHVALISFTAAANVAGSGSCSVVVEKIR